MNLQKQASLRAAAGALFLDKHQPGWEHKLGEEISMSSMRKCMLAQLYGHYRDGAVALNLSETDTHQLGFRACKSDLGNDLKAFGRYYEFLTASWKYEKTKRLKVPALV